MKNGWTHNEMVCYIAHTWAEKEKKVEELQHFDYMDSATRS